MTLDQQNQLMPTPQTLQIAILDKWGPWRFKDNLILVNEDSYEIDLEQINSSAEMLDWIFQINKKNRKEYCVKSLINAFCDIYQPQKNCCSFGQDKKFLGSKLAKKYKKKLMLSVWRDNA